MVRYAINLNGHSIQFEGENLKEVWKEVCQSGALEIFALAGECGCCKGKKTLLNYREVGEGKKTFDYFEVVCADGKCRARLALGQKTDKVGLFPKRKNDDGTWKSNNGWEKWAGPKKEDGE